MQIKVEFYPVTADSMLKKHGYVMNSGIYIKDCTLKFVPTELERLQKLGITEVRLTDI